MPTPHIAAAKGEIAERILLPGDPLRAKYIAENFLEGAKEYTNIRNILGYTGTYKGHPISVQGTGMGMPSISIYVNELIREYGCKTLIRIGSCGACHKDIHIRDVLIAQATTTDSSMPRNIFGASVNFAPVADFDLLRHAYQAAADKGISVRVGNVMSQDRFYDDEMDIQKLASYGVLGLGDGGCGTLPHCGEVRRACARTLYGQRPSRQRRAALHGGGASDLVQRDDRDCTGGVHRLTEGGDSHGWYQTRIHHCARQLRHRE